LILTSVALTHMRFYPILVRCLVKCFLYDQYNRLCSYDRDLFQHFNNFIAKFAVERVFGEIPLMLVRVPRHYFESEH